MMSVALPGVNETMILMGLLGHTSAIAARGVTAETVKRPRSTATIQRMRAPHPFKGRQCTVPNLRNATNFARSGMALGYKPGCGPEAAWDVNTGWARS